MKIACFSDAHAHNFKEFDSLGDRSGSTRLDGIVDSLSYIRGYCDSHHIETALFGGDLFHVRGKINVMVYNAVYREIQAFQASGVHLIMISGNHDQYDNSYKPETSLEILSSEDVEVFDKFGTTVIEDSSNNAVVICCVPYSKDIKATCDFIKKCADEIPTKKILLMHAGVTGGKVGKSSYPLQDAFTLGDLCIDKFDWIVLGHYHRRQMLTKNTFYCGSPVSLNFNDEIEDKGFYVIDTTKGELEFVPIPLPRFITISASSVLKGELEEYSKAGDYLRVIATEEEVQNFVANCPLELKYRIDLQKTYKKEKSRSNIEIGMNFDSIVEQYAKDFNPKAKKVGLNILHEVMNG